MARDDIAGAVAQLGLSLPEDVWRGLEIHVGALLKWQRSINLVSRSTLDEVWTRHVLDSLQLLPLIPAGARTLVDLGSGAGFPGLVVAIARPDLSVRLVESDNRKAVFLGEVARQAAPTTVIVNKRIEAAAPDPADVITARALAPLPELLDWAHRFTIDPTICLFHKGRSIDDELTDAERRWMMTMDRVPSVTAPDAAILRVARLRPRR
ncbi:16S rRNA (guanine(527)-N(7))-methyltransferase RsmG [Vineibacter terrae]|uniref:Ribosomal RNA small subunit methyltransferase G n=1 Tax=Vineibacter terrae TaxID=2586908 RepID=A0A5C8PH81_9HYPH|nr:16S rRNA (guanine(527)-N(7))-methyltransferase RsmG [Vineibacter terrae]TXL73001.1 16S rRNA (guanine(527)-N(7))-methyltransferase RsmG [Vineibacter terrae]